MNTGTELNENYFDRIYDDFSKEQSKLMEQIKQGVEGTARYYQTDCPIEYDDDGNTAIS